MTVNLFFTAVFIIFPSSLAFGMAQGMIPDMSEISEIRSGTYFGECIGYCNQLLRITAEGAEYTVTANVDNAELPPVSGPVQPAAGTWGRLTEALDQKGFAQLPGTIGCPDCADQGGEWIEIRFDDTVKRVDFELAAQIPGLDAPLAIIRALREEGARKYRPR